MIDFKVLLIETAEEAARRALEQAHTSSRYLKPRDAARYIGVAYVTLEMWRCRGQGPDFSRLGRSIRYDRRDLDAFMLRHRDKCDGSAGIPRSIRHNPMRELIQVGNGSQNPNWIPRK